MTNSKFRCATCKQYVDIDDAYLTLAVGRFCSTECVSAKMTQKRAKARSSSKRSRARAGGTGVAARPRKTVPLEVRAAVHRRDSRCRMCGGNGTEVHHVKFRSQGGEDSVLNLALLCTDCHHTHAHGPLAGYWRQVLLAMLWVHYVEGRRRTALETASWLAATGVLAAPQPLRPAS